MALDKVLKDHGGLNNGLQVMQNLLLSELEFADDVALATKDTESVTERLTNLDVHSKDEAGMEISIIPKTKSQHQETPQIVKHH